jgi:hypothetical protein
VGIWARLKQAKTMAYKEVPTVDATPEPTEIYASELLDEHTCQRCAEIDGHEYETLARAEADYPDGGYKGCESETGCRGTLVVMYDE